MDNNGLLKRFASTPFTPCGQDEYGVYMIIEDLIVHVRKDDLHITEHQKLIDIWPMVFKVQSV